MLLWDDPLDGLDFSEGVWDWRWVDAVRDGRTKIPPDGRPGWERWHFVYDTPNGRVKVSADKDPDTGRWFNPHRSTGQP